MKKKICDDDRGVDATNVYLRSWLKPSWISVEFSGGFGNPPGGEIIWGIAGGTPEGAAVSEVVSEVGPVGCMMMVDGTKLVDESEPVG